MLRASGHEEDLDSGDVVQVAVDACPIQVQTSVYDVTHSVAGSDYVVASKALERVVSGSSDEDVVALPSVDHVAIGFTEEAIVSLSALDVVLPVSPRDRVVTDASVQDAMPRVAGAQFIVAITTRNDDPERGGGGVVEHCGLIVSVNEVNAHEEVDIGARDLVRIDGHAPRAGCDHSAKIMNRRVGIGVGYFDLVATGGLSPPGDLPLERSCATGQSLPTVRKRDRA